MLKRLISGALCMLFLTSCQFPGGILGIGRGSATVDLTMASINTLTAVAPYRAQGVSDFTPESYRVTIASIRLIENGDQETEIYQGKEPVELADQASVEAALNASVSVPEGTYIGARIGFSEVHSVKGSAKLGELQVYTKGDSSADAKTGPAEPTEITSRGWRELYFAKPVSIKADERIKLSLVYDLTDSINFYAQIHPDGVRFRDGEGIELKYIPFFAFVGEPPKPEIYKVTIQDTEQVKVTSGTKWHYQMVLFPKDNGELAGLQCIGRIDEGYEGSHFNAINFVNNRLSEHSLNDDGSYHLVGYKEGGGEFPMYEVKSFKRETHSGKVLFYSPWNEPPLSAPAELDYQATKIQ